MDSTGERLHQPILGWYAAHSRDLPWRRPDTSPWGVLVSEVMLQQTPVARVLPVWEAWLDRWPEPADLAGVPAGEAVRMWGRLGYPRRALRLHAAATSITEQHGGAVPAEVETLRSLPGVGDYTAAAVAAFAYRQRVAVLDTNVRRVHARLLTGAEHPAPTIKKSERLLTEALLPADPETAATFSVAVMELGALVCTANSARCEDCPVAVECAWRAAGYPAYDGPARPVQRYDGTDRQCRGRLLDVLREASGSVTRARLDLAWPDGAQRERCLDSLLADGLVVPDGARYALP